MNTCTSGSTRTSFRIHLNIHQDPQCHVTHASIHPGTHQDLHEHMYIRIHLNIHQDPLSQHTMIHQPHTRVNSVTKSFAHTSGSTQIPCRIHQAPPGHTSSSTQTHIKLHPNTHQAPPKHTSGSTQTHIKLHPNTHQTPPKHTSGSTQTHIKLPTQTLIRLHPNTHQAPPKHTSGSTQALVRLHSNTHCHCWHLDPLWHLPH